MCDHFVKLRDRTWPPTARFLPHRLFHRHRHPVHRDAHRDDAGRQFARLDQLGLDVLAATEVLGANRMPNALDAASGIRQSHERDRRVVLDESDPNIDKLGDHHALSTASAYWVHHPIEGDYLVDAGLARAFARDGGNYTRLLRLVLALFGAEAHSTDGVDVASQLRSRGISPRAVFLTHLHGDHTSGLVDLPALVPAVFGRGEATFMQKALIGDHLEGRPLYALDFDEAHALPPFDHVLDLLGDGSIWAISTPGHSPNHVSYLVNAASGPVLITGDACAYNAQFDHSIRPSPGVNDQEAAIRSLAGLRELYDRFPQLQVMVGHDPPRRR